MFKARKRLPDPAFPLILYGTDQKKQTPHTHAIRLIVGLLSAAGVKDINYDHTNTTIPKREVPLRVENRRVDIAFITNGYICFLDVYAVPLEGIKIEQERNGNSETIADTRNDGARPEQGYPSSVAEEEPCATHKAIRGKLHPGRNITKISVITEG